MKKIFPITMVIMLLFVILSGCAPAETVEAVEPEVVVQTQIVTQVVEEETMVEVVVTATPQEQSAQPQNDVEQTFVVGLGSDTGSLNPHDYDSAFPPMAVIYESLVYYAKDGSIQPMLAESWEISEDGLTWIFKLRDDVLFHDGTPFDAEAAKWNLERWIQNERHSWLPVAQHVQSVDIVDEYTIQLNLDSYSYGILQEFSLVRPVRFLSPNAVDADGNYQQAVGTGPWKLESQIANQESVFVPFEDYWGEKPQLEKLVFKTIPDPQTRIAALLSGEIHLTGGAWVAGLSLDSLPVLDRNPNVEILTGEGSSAVVLNTNYQEFPLSDVRFRQALNHAVDRQAISDTIFHELARPAQGLFPDTLPYINFTGSDLYTYNPELSKQLLSDMGYVEGENGMLALDGEPLKLRLLVDESTVTTASSLSQVLQAQFAEVGIEVELKIREYSTWLEEFEALNWDLVLYQNWGAPYDPHSAIYGKFHSRTDRYIQIFTSPELDEMIEATLAEVDEAERQQKYDEMMQYLDENAVSVPIVYEDRVYALSSSVVGYELEGTDYEMNLTGVTITNPGW